MTTQIAKKWYITPIAKRKLAMVHHAHCEKKNGAVNHEKLAAVNQEKCASKVQPISNEK